MATVQVKQTSPIETEMRKKLMNAINTLSPKELKNLDKLLSSKKARGYLSNDLKIKLIT